MPTHLPPCPALLPSSSVELLGLGLPVSAASFQDQEPSPRERRPGVLRLGSDFSQE